MPVKKILIADDHEMTRKGIERLLKTSYPKIEIIEASNGDEVIAQDHLFKPDITLLDYNMPIMNGYAAAQVLLKGDKNKKIILLTMFDTTAIALNFLKIGGRGFISKGCRNEDIIDSIRVVANGNYYFSSENEKEITEWLHQGCTQRVPKINFSPLELGIIVKLSKGLTSKEIGEELKISPRTVETYRYDLLSKVHVKNSNELIDFIYKNGISLSN